MVQETCQSQALPLSSRQIGGSAKACPDHGVQPIGQGSHDRLQPGLPQRVPDTLLLVWHLLKTHGHSVADTEQEMGRLLEENGTGSSGKAYFLAGRKVARGTLVVVNG